MRKLWPKYENWSKLGTEQQLYRYNPKLYRYNLAKNDQKRNCTGTTSNCTGTTSNCTGTTSNCTATSHSKCPKMCVFSHFSICFNPNQLYTSNTHQDYSKIILESLFISIPLSISYLSSKIHHGFLPKPF